MREPIIHLTTHDWPAWHSQPLALTIAEIENPSLVIDNFFDCYHLPDIRTCLQNWLQDALDKPTIESKEHIGTHSEVQKLVEAAWLIHQNGEERSLQLPARREEDSITEEKFNKPKRLIEKVAGDPLLIINKVFEAGSLKFIREGVNDWMHVALVSESIRYSFADQRSALLHFYKESLLLLEALYVINEQQVEKKEIIGTTLLCSEQKSNPISVINDFFNQFPITYVRRELWDWFHAGMAFSGTWPDNLCPEMVFNLYEYLSCLTEAALYFLQRREDLK